MPLGVAATSIFAGADDADDDATVLEVKGCCEGDTTSPSCSISFRFLAFAPTRAAARY